jgi:transcriptional regulator with XRE-family HTH domain
MGADLDLELDLDMLRAKAEQVEELVTPPSADDEQPRSPGPRAERRLSWYRGVEDAVLDLANAMPEGVDDYDVRKLLEFMLELRRRLENDPLGEDRRGEVELTTMQTADVVGRIRRRLLHQRLDDPKIAVQFILRTLAGVPAAEVASLLGVSTKTVTAWRHGNAVRQNARRVILVAQVLVHLRGFMTPRGMSMWFDAERDQLDGRSPLKLLEEDEAAAYPALIALARGGSGQLAG